MPSGGEEVAGGAGGDGGGGGNVLDWVAQLTAETPEPAAESEKVVDASGPVDLLAAALSGNSQMVADAATARFAARKSHDGGVSNHLVPGNGSRNKHSAASSSATPKKKTVPAGQPGGWLTTGGPSGATSLIDRMAEGEGTEEGTSDDDRGGSGKRAVVETATIGVQWEEGVEDAAAVPLASSSGRLPPWAKPYAPAAPKPKAAEEDASDDGLRVVAVASSGVQCGESVLGG